MTFYKLDYIGLDSFHLLFRARPVIDSHDIGYR